MKLRIKIGNVSKRQHKTSLGIFQRECQLKKVHVLATLSMTVFLQTGNNYLAYKQNNELKEHGKTVYLIPPPFSPNTQSL